MDGEAPKQQQSSDQEAAVDDAPAIRCAACDQDIAHPDDVFTVASSPVQVFANAYGHLHEVITVRRAANVVHIGIPTDEFTWFAGYTWQLCHCGRCNAHLGWRYMSEAGTEPVEYWGLRSTAVKS